MATQLHHDMADIENVDPHQQDDKIRNYGLFIRVLGVIYIILSGGGIIAGLIYFGFQVYFTIDSLQNGRPFDSRVLPFILPVTASTLVMLLLTMTGALGILATLAAKRLLVQLTTVSGCLVLLSLITIWVVNALSVADILYSGAIPLVVVVVITAPIVAPLLFLLLKLDQLLEHREAETRKAGLLQSS